MQWIISLWDDRREIEELGTARYEDNVRWHRAERHSPTPPSVGKHIAGVRWEFGVARGLRVEPAISRILGYPRPSYDGIYRGWTYEVKGTEHSDGHLLYQPKLHKLGMDIWFLVVDVDAEEWLVRLAGWVLERRMSELWAPCRFDKSAWCIAQYDLDSFDFMKDLAPKG